MRKNGGGACVHVIIAAFHMATCHCHPPLYIECHAVVNRMLSRLQHLKPVIST